MHLMLFRRHLRIHAVAVLLTVVVCGGTVDWGHAGWDDPGCNPVLVQHDHSAHRVKPDARGTGGDSDHCTLCHLLRTFHTALSVKSLPVHVVLSAAPRSPFDSPSIVALSALSVPSRAPPALVV
jgi:hypothetical protein